MTFGREGLPQRPAAGWETFGGPVDAAGWAGYIARLCPIWKVRLSLPGAPDAITASALIDTGASHSYATAALLAELGAVPTGKGITVYGASEAGFQTREYRLDVELPYTSGGEVMRARSKRITDGVLSFGGDRPQYGFVIGGDLLAHVRFTLDGPGKRFRIDPP